MRAFLYIVIESPPFVDNEHAGTFALDFRVIRYVAAQDCIALFVFHRIHTDFRLCAAHETHDQEWH